MEFKDRIKELRSNKNMTQSQIAALLNKGEGAVRAWESGKSKADADTLIKLAEYFGCTSDYLLGLSDVRNEADRESSVLFEKSIFKTFNGLNHKLKQMYQDTIVLILASFHNTQKDNAYDATLLDSYNNILADTALIYNSKYFEGLANDVNLLLHVAYKTKFALDDLISSRLKILGNKELQSLYLLAYDKYKEQMINVKEGDDQ